MVEQALDQRESRTPVLSVTPQVGLDLAVEVLGACQALWEAVHDTEVGPVDEPEPLASYFLAFSCPG